MGLTRDENKAHYQIHAYQPGSIQLNDITYKKSMIVTPAKLIECWPPQYFKELAREHFDMIGELRPAILLIGTGKTLQFPDITLYGRLINEGIGIEIMDTAAACRTYNALTAENRNVAAALIIH
ncbi:MAG: hypothetical protein ACD_60C00005G0012 [uncultured bacterium]|nr:MAG: hypothetical protein ACD_60C00005G0012 [uncultured bacterium]